MILIISYHFNSSVIITKCYAVFVGPPAASKQDDNTVTHHNNNEPAADSQGVIESPPVENLEKGKFVHQHHFLFKFGKFSGCLTFLLTFLKSSQINEH